MSAQAIIYPDWLKKFSTKLEISKIENDPHSNRHIEELLRALVNSPNNKVVVLIDEKPHEISLDADRNIIVRKLEEPGE